MRLNKEEACKFSNVTFCFMMEQTGQLKNIKDATEIPTLPKEVMWVRYPNGDIEKIR